MATTIKQVDNKTNKNRELIIENTKGIALIQKDITYIRESIDTLIGEIKDFKISIKIEFVTKGEHSELVKEVEELSEFKDKIVEIVIKYSIASSLAVGTAVVFIIKLFDL